MAQLVVPSGVEWELVVVNNNSTDDTEHVLASYTERLPIRAFFEPRPGKSHALNHAVDEANGDYLLITDDDVLVDADWLQGYSKAFERHPDAAVFGGPITAWFAGDPPPWLVETFHQVEFAYAALNLGHEIVSLNGRIGPFGANMAIRTEDQRRKRYDPTLGPQPGTGLRGEETAVVKAILANGGEAYWVPEARVRHYIPRERQTTEYLRRWYRGWGELLALTRKHAPSRMLLGRPLWLWREVVEAGVRYRAARAFARPTVWVEELKKASIAEGRFAKYPRPQAKRRSPESSSASTASRSAAET